MKRTALLIAVALAAGVACAQDDASGNGSCPQGKAWGHKGGQPAWGQMDKRGNDRPRGPLDSAEMEQMHADHEAIRDLAGAARLETDPAKKAALIEQLREKLGVVADRMQAKQEQRLAQAEERLAGLKEKIEYGKTHRAELIEEQVQRILAGKRPDHPAAFDQFPNAKGGMHGGQGPACGGLPPPAADEAAPPPPEGEELPGDLPPPPAE